jgi:ferredoxin-NADP reductase
MPPVPHKIDGLPDRPCGEPHSFTFLPGQWLDTYVPHLAKPGGFSLVSSPQQFKDYGTFCLAIQQTDNPPSMWLWQDDILGQYLMIKVGGNFTFPPSHPAVDLAQVDYIQFIAGGVGIKYSALRPTDDSPLISMLRFIHEECPLKSGARIAFHYLVKAFDGALFVDDIYSIKAQFKDRFSGHIWITRQEAHVPDEPPLGTPDAIHKHRLEAADPDQVGQPWKWWDSFSHTALEHFHTPEKRQKSLIYICGPQGLTDRLVELYNERGLRTDDGHVQIEKWW